MHDPEDSLHDDELDDAVGGMSAAGVGPQAQQLDNPFYEGRDVSSGH